MIASASSFHFRASALQKSPAALDAYDCPLRARRYTSALSGEMHAESRDLLENAVALDPNYADAHALLANVYFAEHRFDANLCPDPVGRALKAAETATRLNPRHPGGYHFSFARHRHHLHACEDMLVDVQRISMPDFYWTHMLDAAAFGQLGRARPVPRSPAR